eukprot:8338856-Pyramimonas_sp.AAC.2
MSAIDLLRKEVANQSKDIDQQVQQAVRPQLDAFHCRMQAQLDQTNARVNTLEQRADSSEAEITKLK